MVTFIHHFSNDSTRSQQSDAMARMIIRQAFLADAEAGSALLRRAITELCVADHASDPGQIAEWVANKTPQTWLEWLRQTDSLLYVAEDGGRIVGVCMVHRAGNLLLNYVSPDCRFQGVSKAMLARMEADVMAAGSKEMTLDTTQTAYAFYRAAGYEPIATGSMRLRKRLDFPAHVPSADGPPASAPSAR